MGGLMAIHYLEARTKAIVLMLSETALRRGPE
jgi:hypothetical protein